MMSNKYFVGSIKFVSRNDDELTANAYHWTLEGWAPAISRDEAWVGAVRNYLRTGLSPCYPVWYLANTRPPHHIHDGTSLADYCASHGISYDPAPRMISRLYVHTPDGQMVETNKNPWESPDYDAVYSYDTPYGGIILVEAVRAGVRLNH